MSDISSTCGCSKARICGRRPRSRLRVACAIKSAGSAFFVSGRPNFRLARRRLGTVPRSMSFVKRKAQGISPPAQWTGV